MVSGNDLVRRRPGQRGCCGCGGGLAMMLGLLAFFSIALRSRSRSSSRRRGNIAN